MEKYGLIGYPLEHSFSPQIHKRIFELEGINADYALYLTKPADFLESLPKFMNLRGFNLTMPYKQTIIQYLDSLHESSQLYGAVNTVSNTEALHTGYNTDCVGFLKTLEAHNIKLRGRVCILGAGGVGRMFAIESARAGAYVTIAVRESGIERANAVSHELKEKFNTSASVVNLTTLEEAFDLIINATPCGMFPNVNSCPVSRGCVEKAMAVFDCIYNPAETLLLKYAYECGILCAGGMDMLVWQAAAAHEYWNGTHFENGQINSLIEEISQITNSKGGYIG